MRTRTTLTVGALIAALTAVPVLVLADSRPSGEGQFPIDRQKFQFRTDPTSTTSREWTYLNMVGSEDPGDVAVLSRYPIRLVNRGGMTVTLSGEFRGAPVELRMRRNNDVLRPGKTEFNGSSSDSSFSYTWLGRNSGDPECTSVWLEWRSPTGNRTRFERGNLVVTYKPEALKGGAACAD